MDVSFGILGCGAIGSIIVDGLMAKKIFPKINVFDIDPIRLEQFKDAPMVQPRASEAEVIQNSNLILLAVKPQVAAHVLQKIAPEINQQKYIITIMAGIPTSFIRKYLPDVGAVVRVMPNTPLLVSRGMSVLSFEETVPDEIKQVARQIFSALGEIEEQDEKYMDIVTGLSGSGPAYVLSFLEGLADGALKMGMNKKTALKLIANTALGTAKLYLEKKLHPAELRDLVTSPAGTTIAGLSALEKGNFRRTLMKAVEKATTRSMELGKSLK